MERKQGWKETRGKKKGQMMLDITTWNCGGIYGNFSYAKSLLKTCDLQAVTEYWLYRDELSFLETLGGDFKCHCS